MSRPEPDTAARRQPVRRARGQRFTAAMAAVVRRLPFGLSRVVPPTVLGYSVINGFTFTFDLTLLSAFHGGLRWLVFGDSGRAATAVQLPPEREMQMGN